MNNLNCEQGTKHWLELRKEHIGSSDIACINGTNPYKSAYTLWLEKTGKKEPDKENFAMKHGKEMEPVARNFFIDLSDVAIIPSVQISKEWNVAMASLDGLTTDNKTIVEIKCPLTEKLYKLAKDGTILPMYMDQIQWQLWVTKAEKCVYFVYMDEFAFESIEVFPDIPYQKMLVEKAKEFWDRVLNDDPPTKNKTDPIYISEIDDNELAQEWKNLKLQQKDFEVRIKDIENQLLEKYKETKTLYRLILFHLY